jgi:hypothetical protein
MNVPRNEPSAADLASEAGGLATGLGIVTMTFFPLALPGLLLLLPVVVLALPLLLVGGVGYLVARLLRRPLRWARGALLGPREVPEAGYPEDRAPVRVQRRPAPGGIPATRR